MLEQRGRSAGMLGMEQGCSRVRSLLLHLLSAPCHACMIVMSVRQVGRLVTSVCRSSHQVTQDNLYESQKPSHSKERDMI